MAPFTRWLPVNPEGPSDLAIEMAGDGDIDLNKGAAALEQALADQGYEVIAQADRHDGIGPVVTVRFRVSVEPIRSMGSGCDVLVYLGRKLPDDNRFHLQRGSVLLCEAECISRSSEKAIPEGVIAYPIPFSRLHLRRGTRTPGRGFFALGALTHLLGMPEAPMLRRVRPDFNLRYFQAGVRFATEHLTKRDIYTFPPPPARPHRKVALDAHRAMVLGLAIGTHCGCGPTCLQDLGQSPLVWVEKHVSAAWQAVSNGSHRKVSFVNALRSPDGDVMAIPGVMDPIMVMEKAGDDPPVVLVASDLPDLLHLILEARRVNRVTGSAVRVVVEDLLTSRAQSVAINILEEMVHEAERLPVPGTSTAGSVSALAFGAERNSEPGAEIGYVAWGVAQGVVREALGLCRNFGLKVAALFPKVLWPVPCDDLYSFAQTVKRLVVVDPSRDGHYTRLVASSTSLRFSSIMPEPGQPLTPMDIFLREDLGSRRSSNE
jgi:hypothetical protein